MKVGIVTFEFNYNYGATLQATALRHVIETLGHEAEIVNRGWEITPPKIVISDLSRL